MQGYIKDRLHKFQHNALKRAQHAPHKWNRPNYGAKVQPTMEEDTTMPLAPADIKRIQQIVGTILYYGHKVDLTMLAALSDIGAAQAKGTKAIMAAVKQLFDYGATHPDAVLCYSASNMKLKIHSDTSYLLAPNARSMVGGYFYLGNNKPDQNPNGTILVTVNIMKNVMAAAPEAEVGALYENAKLGVPLRNTLKEMGWEQQTTPIVTDNLAVNGLVNIKITQKKSRAMDKRFYWVQDMCDQGQFGITWEPGKINLGDYLTKHHPSLHHQKMRLVYLTNAISVRVRWSAPLAHRYWGM